MYYDIVEQKEWPFIITIVGPEIMIPFTRACDPNYRPDDIFEEVQGRFDNIKQYKILKQLCEDADAGYRLRIGELPGTDDE